MDHLVVALCVAVLVLGILILVAFIALKDTRAELGDLNRQTKDEKEKNIFLRQRFDDLLEYLGLIYINETHEKRAYEKACERCHHRKGWRTAYSESYGVSCLCGCHEKNAPIAVAGSGGAGGGWARPYSNAQPFFPNAPVSKEAKRKRRAKK
jgi:hypothetical protein